MKLKKTFVAILSCVMVGSMCIAAENVLPDSLTTITASAANIYGDLRYENHDTYIEISGCDKSATSVVIPEEIDGLPVTSIGYEAFYECENLTSIKIPDSVTSIGMRAFCGCDNLTSITIPDSVTSIDSEAFYGCDNLMSIIIPPSVTEINSCALGYIYDDGLMRIMNSFTIYGTPGTAAEKYALEKGITFIDVNNTSTITMGDINSDGNIDALDASDILIEYANVATGKGSSFDEAQIKAADLNNDGAVDALDASTVLIYYAYKATGGTASFVDYLNS